jgi:hypothetical protein
MHLPQSTTEGGKSVNLAPDQCWTPTPPAPSPPPGILLPYPNMASPHRRQEDHDEGPGPQQEVPGRGQLHPKSTGDEPGCNQPTPMGKMGMKSRKQMGKCEFSSHSSKVKMEGKGVIFHTASTKHNDGNTVGKHGVPSQRVVLVAK